MTCRGSRLRSSTVLRESFPAGTGVEKSVGRGAVGVEPVVEAVAVDVDEHGGCRRGSREILGREELVSQSPTGTVAEVRGLAGAAREPLLEVRQAVAVDVAEYAGGAGGGGSHVRQGGNKGCCPGSGRRERDTEDQIRYCRVASPRRAESALLHTPTSSILPFRNLPCRLPVSPSKYCHDRSCARTMSPFRLPEAAVRP